MTHLGPSLRRAKIRERPARRLALALLVSLLLNAAGLAYLQGAGAFDSPAAQAPKRVSLAPLSASEWAANRAVRGERPPPAAAPKPAEPFAMPRPPEKKVAEPEPPPMHGQVVDVAPSKEATPPKSTRFLSDRDNSVEKETISKHRKAGYEHTLPVPSAPGIVSAPPPGQDGRADRAVPGLEGKPAQPEGRAGTPKVAMAPQGNGDLVPAKPTGEGGAPAPVPEPGQGEGGQRLLGPPSAKSLITPGTLARVAGGPAPDHVEGIDEGEGTFLNTRGWKYATYFNRIKQAVAAVWDPTGPLEARDPDRTMYGYKDRFTLLGVTLDDAGHVKNLVVEQTSGVDFLDRAAMSAFREAQPFVNPPRGIVDPNGEIRFSFGFFLEVGHSGLRIYRAPIPANP